MLFAARVLCATRRPGLAARFRGLTVRRAVESAATLSAARIGPGRICRRGEMAAVDRMDADPGRRGRADRRYGNGMERGLRR
ncbi:hypothetical protein G6F68_020956 [Rhizopus microsporus]|nr:hypothetical protein G6F68_020956 [Rhizopus microsporus]